MESRHDLAAQQRDALVQEIVANAKVFQGGGTSCCSSPWKPSSVRPPMPRWFACFRASRRPTVGSAWEAVIKRARAWRRPDRSSQSATLRVPRQHPVCQQVLATIGAGKIGIEIRKALEASPFGWPQDAIDAALIALHRSQHITATLNGSAVAVGQLDQNKISKAEFRVEKSTLSVQDRLSCVGLFAFAESCRASNNLGEKAPEFLSGFARAGELRRRCTAACRRLLRRPRSRTSSA